MWWLVSFRYAIRARFTLHQKRCPKDIVHPSDDEKRIYWDKTSFIMSVHHSKMQNSFIHTTKTILDNSVISFINLLLNFFYYFSVDRWLGYVLVCEYFGLLVNPIKVSMKNVLNTILKDFWLYQLSMKWLWPLMAKF